MKKTDQKIAETVTRDVINRRDFFGMAWKALGIIAALEAGGMMVSYFFSGKNRKTAQTKQLLEAGPVNGFLPGSVSAFMGGRFYLARQQDGGFIALSLRCTHWAVPFPGKKTKKDSSVPAILLPSISVVKF